MSYGIQIEEKWWSYLLSVEEGNLLEVTEMGEFGVRYNDLRLIGIGLCRLGVLIFDFPRKFLVWGEISGSSNTSSGSIYCPSLSLSIKSYII